MNISRKHHQKRIFVLTPDDIRALDQLFSDIGNRTYEAECADGRTRTFETVDELLTYENPKRKAMVVLRIVALTVQPRQMIVASLGNERFSNVYVTFDAKEETGEILTEKFEDLLAGTRPWYAPIARTDFIIVLVVLFTIAWFLLVVSGRLEDFISSVHPSVTTLATALVVGFIPNLVGWPLNKLRHRYFPTGVFALGQGARRHKDQEVVRVAVFVGFIISVLAGIVTPAILALGKLAR